MDTDAVIALIAAVIAGFGAYVARSSLGVARVSADAAKDSAAATASMFELETKREQRALAAELAPQFSFEGARWGWELGKPHVNVVLRNVGSSSAVITEATLRSEITSTQAKDGGHALIETGELTLVEFVVTASAAELSVGALLLDVVYESPQIEYRARATFWLRLLDDGSEGSWESDDRGRISRLEFPG